MCFMMAIEAFRAQPDGFVNAISWRFKEDLASAFDRLSAGDLDLMAEEPGPDDLAVLRATHPDQVVAWPGSFTVYAGFDVRKPPFDDERVRQALNYAIDRDHIVDLLGGSTIQRPTCQILPPNFQGYAPFCPFTLEPENGVWSAPDLDRAQALIEEAGAAGERVTVSVTDAGPGFLPSGSVETMRYITEVLNDLGLRATLDVEANGQAYFDAFYPPAAQAGTPEHPHLYMTGWFSDYPGAGNFIDPQFACGARGFANPSGWCNEALDAEMDEALLLLTTDPGAANRAWMEIEHQLIEDAALVPLTNPVTTHAVSDRVGNVQVNPQWGILLSRLWVD